jgi:hypothetical protein
MIYIYIYNIDGVFKETSLEIARNAADQKLVAHNTWQKPEDIPAL